MGRNVPTTTLWADFLQSQYQEQRLPDRSPDTCLSSRPEGNNRCCFYELTYDIKWVENTDCCCGNWHRLSGGTNCQGPRGCSTLNAPSSSNTTVFDITRLPNAAGQCKDNEHTSHANMYLPSIYPGYYKGSLLNGYKHFHGAPGFSSLQALRQYACTGPI